MRSGLYACASKLAPLSACGHAPGLLCPLFGRRGCPAGLRSSRGHVLALQRCHFGVPPPRHRPPQRARCLVVLGAHAVRGSNVQASRRARAVGQGAPEERPTRQAMVGSGSCPADPIDDWDRLRESGTESNAASPPVRLRRARARPWRRWRPRWTGFCPPDR